MTYKEARAEIIEWVSQTLGCEPDQVDVTKPLPELGIDSLDAVHLIATIESLIQTELPEDVIQRVSCLNDILELMADRLAAA